MARHQSTASARLALALLALPAFAHALLGRDLKDKLRAMNLPPKQQAAADAPGHDPTNALNPPVVASLYLPDNYAEGQAATEVVLEGWDGPAQHAGFFNFTAERSDGAAPTANTFFWYLPALDRNPDAEVLLWLQGGPGGSSLYGMFTEIGPFTISADGAVVSRAETSNWNQHYDLLFLDNPCGVGFSWSADASCFVSNEVEVGADLYAALVQFYQLFPAKRSSSSSSSETGGGGLFITGESYAGKYIPAAAYTIFTRNPTAGADEQVPLRGLSVGDGALDPPAQFQGFGPLLWHLGMVSAAERAEFDRYEAQIAASLAAGDPEGAFGHFDEMLNGDFAWPTYYYNVTGMTNYFNFEQGDCGTCAPDYFSAWLDTDSVRNAIHVGDLPYASFNDTVEEHLVGDWMVGVVDMLVPLLESPDVRVLVYSGQNDVILGAPLTEQFLDGLAWSGADTYRAAPKQAWTVATPATSNDPLAGYVKRAVGPGAAQGAHGSSANINGSSAVDLGFTYAVVRGAGHMVPTDQPERAYDLISRFVGNDWGDLAARKGKGVY